MRFKGVKECREETAKDKRDPFPGLKKGTFDPDKQNYSGATGTVLSILGQTNKVQSSRNHRRETKI